LRYNYEGINISGGLAGQDFNLTGRFAGSNGATNFTNVDKSYFTWLPNISFNLDLKNNKYSYGGYSVYTQEPSSKDLLPVQDKSIPFFVTEGNPNLLPSKTHEIYSGFGMFNPASFTNINFNLNFSSNQNQVIYNQIIVKDSATKALTTFSKPENLSGGSNFGGYFGFGFPLKKTKSNLNINTNFNFTKNPVYINGVLNDTKNNNYNIGLRLDFTPSEAFTFYGNAQLSFTTAQYSINTAQNQEFVNHNFGGEMNIKLPKDFYFSTNFRYMIYRNERFGFDQQIPIWNAAIYKILGKSKKAEIRLSAFDILKKNLGVTQNATSNYILQQQTQTLSRYFMLSFTYNMRGVSANLKKRNFY
jgi:Outer membrane protein beta-barrel family